MTNFDRFKDIPNIGIAEKVNTAFSFYLQENYSVKEMEDKSLETEGLRFSMWLFKTWRGSKLESDIKTTMEVLR